MSLSDLQGVFISLSNLPTPVLFALVVTAVFVVVVIVGWLVRRVSTKQFGEAAARNPRLAVMDAAPVDGRRQLIIIRRDTVEHLLIIGGPTDVVVETNIARGNAAATAPNAVPARAALTVAETLPRTPAPAAAREYGEHRQQRENVNAAATTREAAPARAATVAETLPRTPAPLAAREHGEHRQQRENMASTVSNARSLRQASYPIGHARR